MISTIIEYCYIDDVDTCIMGSDIVKLTPFVELLDAIVGTADGVAYIDTIHV